MSGVPITHPPALAVTAHDHKTCAPFLVHRSVQLQPSRPSFPVWPAQLYATVRRQLLVHPPEQKAVRLFDKPLAPADSAGHGSSGDRFLPRSTPAEKSQL